MKNTFLTPNSPLGRPLDFAYRSNRLVMAVSVVVAAGFFLVDLVSEANLPTSWWAAGVAVFLAWAIGRELDPDRTGVAAMAMAISVVFVLIASPSLLTATAILLAVRLASGTVGLPLGRVEVIVLVAMSVAIGLDGGALAALPAMLIAILISDGTMKRATAAAVLVVALGTFALVRPGLESSPFRLGAAVVLVFTAATLWLALRVPEPSSVCDVGGMPLQARRIAVSRILAAATVALAFLLEGQSGGLAVTATVGSSLFAVGVFQLMPTKWHRRGLYAGAGRGSS